jgi:hypothetical protein
MSVPRKYPCTTILDRPQMRRGDSAYYKRLAAMRKNKREAKRKAKS